MVINAEDYYVVVNNWRVFAGLCCAGPVPVVEEEPGRLWELAEGHDKRQQKAG